MGRLSRMMDDGNQYEYGPYRVYSSDGHGGLAVSRALGNTSMRPFVSGEPEGFQGRADTYEFLIVASDGLWDVMSAEAACWAVLEGPGQGAGQRLVDAALGKGSQDNVTAAVLSLRA